MEFSTNSLCGFEGGLHRQPSSRSCAAAHLAAELQPLGKMSEAIAQYTARAAAAVNGHDSDPVRQTQRARSVWLFKRYSDKTADYAARS